MYCEFVFRPIDKWPHEKKARPKRAQFRANYNRTLDDLNSEMAQLGVRRACIQIDVPESQIRLDGLPRSDARPNFQGVILSFECKYGPLKYATDTFDHWQDNLRAIALGLEALRQVERYGITKRGEQYSSWKQLPASGNIDSLRYAAEFISTHSGSSVNGIIESEAVRDKAYRAAALKLHLDKGGNTADFCTLQKAKELLDNSSKI